MNREHHSTTKPIIQTLVVALDSQPDLFQIIGMEASLCGSINQCCPIIGRISQFEFFDDIFAISTFLEVMKSNDLSHFGGPHFVLEKLTCPTAQYI
ncbi:hypothetical protein D3C87_1719830 [compost metagenome]